MKTRIFILSLLALTLNQAFAADHVVCHDGTQFFTRGYFKGEGDSSQYSGTDCDFDPQIPSLSLDKKYWKRQSPGLWVSFTAQEIADKNAFELATSTNSIEVQAILGVDAFDSVSLTQRGFALVSLDEINNLRQWIESFKTAVAASTSLGNLQTRVAALSAMPDRTKAQIIPAAKNKISSGGAD